MKLRAAQGWDAVLRHLRGAPVSVALAVVVLGVALATAWTAGPVRPLVLEDLPGAWPHLLTSPVSTPDLLRALAAALGVLVLGGAAERRLGPARFLGSFVGGQMVALLLTWALARAVTLVDPVWGTHLLTAPVGSPWPGVWAAAVAASVPMHSLWRRRVWSAAFPLLLVAAAFAGEPQDVAVLLAAGLGVLLGAWFFPGQIRRARVVGSRHEIRVLTATSVAAVAVGILLSLGSPHLVGPLSATRFLFAGAAYTPGEVLALCADRARENECDRAVYVLRETGVGTTLLSVLPLLLQLVLAEGLRRGRRAALVGTLVLQGLLAVLAAAHLFIGVRYDGSLPGNHLAVAPGSMLPGARLIVPVLVPLLLAGAVLANRRSFRVRAQEGTYRRFWVGVLVVTAAVAATIVVGGLAVREQFVPDATLRGLLSDVGVALLPSTALTVLTPLSLPDGTLAKVLVQWLPILPWAVSCVLLARSFRPVEEGTADQDAYRRTVREVAPVTSTLSWLGTWAGNQTWTSADRRAAVAYRTSGGVALTVGDPVCAPEDLEAVVREFAEHCASRALVPALYSVHPGTEAVTARLGWTSVQVAQEALLALGEVGFRGKAFQDVRTALNRAGRDGVVARWTTWQDASEGRREQLREISRAWLADKALPEMGFTLGGLAEMDDPQVRLLLAEDGEGRVHGVTSWLPVHDGGEVVGLTLDVMRRREDGFRSVMEFLIARAALDAQEEGMRLLSLSGAPLAHAGRPDGEAATTAEDGSGDGSGGRDQALLTDVLDWLGRVLEPAYGFRSLHAFKAKFGVSEEPLYLCLPDPGDLPLVGRAVAHAYLPHLRVVDGVRLGRTLTRADR
ncbi:bifunctional lysylphosphatidylglycerol flippase/synthetase MprF [Ornithinimicrobium avium]|uniref:DUF2156 domain-containing protein n=1 Tax=Ornithinimicrobium avium TaxID=2283195 RepID=A0A345NKX9_9MICO|nr:DUF2156 domain-containing protein [Ornithinimicrobium avium]AXH95687.1 DUF2156 domain-containing protein [Ornithinimicrobium avium]